MRASPRKPTEKVYQVRNGKKIVKERSYLPGYVLVEAALVGEVAHHLRNTPNVIGFWRLPYRSSLQEAGPKEKQRRLEVFSI